MRERAVVNYPKYSFLKTRVSSEIVERLQDSPRRFPLALDLGSHTGAVARALQASGTVDTVFAADLSEGMVQAAGALSFAADEEHLPVADEALDLIVSALNLHAVNDLPGSLIQIRRALKPDGLFLGALFGAGTLKELRTSLLQAESEITGGAAQRVSPLPGLQDMAGLLQRADFALPVADIDHVTVRYATPFALLDDLKGMGERAVFADGSRPPLSRRILARMAEIYAEQFSDADGKVRATFELVWLSGWAPSPDQPKPLRPGSAKVSLAKALGGQEISAGEKAGAKPEVKD